MDEKGKQTGPGMLPSQAPAVVRTVESDVHVATTIVESLGSVDVDLPENWTLNDYVDADALDRLFAPTVGGNERDTGTVVIEVESVTVVVESDRETTVSVHPER